MKFYLIEIARGDEFTTKINADNIHDARKESEYYTSRLTERERAEQTAYIVSPSDDWDPDNESIFERAEYVEQI
jgi:hypothetical protein